MNTEAHLARWLQAFFTERLMHQRKASPHTLASYRNTFCLLLRLMQKRNRKAPATPSKRGGPLSRDSVEHLLAKHVATAAQHCPSLIHKHVTPHVLRHSAAMDLLQHGVDSAVIALWLGHESIETPQIYLHASLKIKEQALEKTSPVNVPPGRPRRLIFILSCLAAIEEPPVITTILLSDDYSKPPFCRNNLYATARLTSQQHQTAGLRLGFHCD